MFVFSVVGQGGIIVNDADSVWESPTNISQDLINSTNGIGPRFIVQSANTIQFYNLIGMPDELQNLLQQTLNKFTILGANSNYTYLLQYPTELIGDTTPPLASGITAVPGNGTTLITWITDEFANSEVRYGTQSGVYSSTIVDPLYVKEHSVTLAGLVAGITYYYQIRSTDQSGNMFQSQEYSFTAQSSVYLPVIVR